MKSIIKQLYTILLVTVACLTVTGCSDDFKSGLRLNGDVWVNSIRLDEYAGYYPHGGHRNESFRRSQG